MFISKSVGGDAQGGKPVSENVIILVTLGHFPPPLQAEGVASLEFLHRKREILGFRLQPNPRLGSGKEGILYPEYPELKNL